MKHTGEERGKEVVEGEKRVKKEDASVDDVEKEKRREE